MLHPPYTAMVLSFVVVGAALAPRLSGTVLLGTLVAYLAGLGVGAHFLDQLPGMGSRYVRHWPAWALWLTGLVGISVGVTLGVAAAVLLHRPPLLLFVALQALCAVGYPLAPVFGRALHRDSVFAISWGSLPCVTSYYAQTGSLSLPAVLLAAVFAAIAVAEIRLSRQSRVSRQGAAVTSTSSDDHPHRRPSGVPAELALKLMSAGTALVALGLLAGRLLLPW